MEEAGFCDIAFGGTTGFSTSEFTIGALFRAGKPSRATSRQV